MMTKSRRQTISDSLITSEMQKKIAVKVLEKVEDIYNISQIELVRIMLDMKLANETIAKVVNNILPNARATRGSIASLVRHIRDKNNLLDELLKELE